MDSEFITSPIIQTTPGSTRIFSNQTSNQTYDDDNESIDNRRNCCFIKNCGIPRKRVFLLFLGLLYFVSVEHTQHYLHFPLIIAATSFIIFYNFPLLVYFSNTKPLYYEDLFIDTTRLPIINLDNQLRKHFEYTFELTLVTTNSILLGALSDYWIYKTEEKHALIEIIGITGGILKIFQFVNNVIGSLLLYLISLKIEKTVKREKQKTCNNSLISNNNILKNKKIKNKKIKKRNSKKNKTTEMTNMSHIQNTKHLFSPNEDNLPIINENGIENYNFTHYDSDHYDEYDSNNIIVERFQLPKNVIERSKQFKQKYEQERKIQNDKQKKEQKMEDIHKTGTIVRIKEEKNIKRNMYLTDTNNFKRVGKNRIDSPHPLRNLDKQIIDNESKKKIEKNLNRIEKDEKDEKNEKNEKDEKDEKDDDCVIIDIPSPISDTEIHK